MKYIHIHPTHLRSFMSVAETGSFSEAASVVGLTQSAVSHAIASLETILGVALLERGRDGVRVTAVGQRVLIHARAAVAHTDAIRQEAAAAHGLTMGKLRVGSFPSVAAQILPKLLRTFRHCYPGIEVVLFEGTDQEVQAWLAARVIDVGIVTLPTDELDTVALTSDTMMAVVAVTHPLAALETVHVERLAHEPFILSKSGCEPLIHHIFRTAGVVPQTQFEVRDSATILAMVEEDLGVTIVPALALPTIHPHVRAIPLEPPVQRQIALAVRAQESRAPAVNALLAHAQSMVEVD
jgi:DNA-binding transcriptional LysR family regulator